MKKNMFFQSYFRSKIGRSILSVFFALVILLMGFNFTMVINSAKKTSETVVINYQNMLETSINQMQDRFMDLKHYTYALTIDDELNRFSIDSNVRSNLFAYVQFQKRIRSYCIQRQMPVSLSVWLPKQGWLISSANGVLDMSDKREVLYEVAETNMRWKIRADLIDGQSPIVGISTGYVQHDQSSPIFYIEITSEDVLKSFLPLVGSEDIEGVMLIDNDGCIVCNTSGDADGVALDKEIIDQLYSDRGSGMVQTQYQSGKNTYTMQIQRVPEADFAVGILLNDKTVFMVGRMIVIDGVLETIGFLIITFLYLYITYRQVLYPINSLMAKMRKVGSGDLDIEHGHQVSNEIGELDNSFVDMTRRLKEHIQQAYINEVQMAQTQMRVYRAQINPHFLYNCLFSLYTYIKNEELDSAADMAVYLGKYYQINTRTESSTTMLYKELENIQLLVKIQSMRFVDRFVYEEDVDESLRLMEIPNLTIMTIAENFLTHGLKEIREKAKLKISAKKHENEIVLRVADTGCGISEDKMNEIRKMLESSVFDYENVHGIRNVLIRFRALWGEKVCLQVYHNVPHGLVVEIIIPKEGE